MKGRGQSGSPPGAPPQRPDGGAGKAQRPEVEAALTLARTAERRADAPEPRVASRGALARAVQILEHTGAHSHAAALRLEYAYSVCGTMQRIGMLREGCARISGDSDEGRALHRALAEALLRQATVMDDGAPRRGLLIEAAAALEIADEADKAGEIYSQLGLLQRAAKAYEQAGAISRLEYTLALLERQEVAQRARAAVEHEIDDALRHGSRRLALELLREHIAGLDLVGPGDHAGSRRELARRLAALESHLPHARQLTLRHGGRAITRVHCGETLAVGRSPECDLVVSGAALSRVHVRLSLVPDLSLAIERGGPRLVIAAMDEASRAGSFWDGEPLEPGAWQLLERRGELGLGFSASLEIAPITPDQSDARAERATGGAELDSDLGALVRRVADDEPWTLFMPGGGPLVLTPDLATPARIRFDAPFYELSAEPEVLVELAGAPVGRGAQVELLVGDRVTLRPSRGAPIELEVLR